MKKRTCLIASENYISELVVRYWGIGKNLNRDEKEVLMFALSLENEKLGGTIHAGAARLLKEKTGEEFPAPAQIPTSSTAPDSHDTGHA